jgi:hypothetical protein
VIQEGLLFKAVKGKNRSPVIEAYGFAAMQAGSCAKGEKKQEKTARPRHNLFCIFDT